MAASGDDFTRPGRLRFGPFEFDPASGELRREGSLVRLPPQPSRVLTLLALRPGEIVTRDELCRSLWGEGTFVDFEQGLNFCVRRIRFALGDDAGRPRYVETFPRRGYRFIAPVEPVAHPGRAAAPEGRTMLAVLPFENLSGDPEQEYFSDGLTEELITQLGRMNPSRMAVIARTSAMSYKGTDKTIGQIGHELGVQYVLEGSVRHARGRLRMAAQLIVVQDQTHLWAESYERDMTDVLALQSEMGGAVAREIDILLAAPRAEASPAARPPAVSPSEYEAYLKGRYCWNRRTLDGVRKGIQHFEVALRSNPEYARAYVGLSDCYAQLGDLGLAAMPPREAFARASEAVSRAIEIEETLAEAHTSLAHLRMHAFDWDGAEKEFLRAIELDPNYAHAWHWYALYLAARESHSEAMTTIRRAERLDPVCPAIGDAIGVLFYFARDFDSAIEQNRKVLEMDPNFARTHAVLGSIYARAGRVEEAVPLLERAVALAADNAKKAALAQAYALAGRRDEARSMLDRLTNPIDGSYVPTYPIALIHEALGNRTEALDWLDRAVEEGAPDIVFLNVEPWLDDLRPDPRFRDLLRRVGLA